MAIDLNLSNGKERIYINEKLYGKRRYIDVNFGDYNIIYRAKKANENIQKRMKEYEMKDPNMDWENVEFIGKIDNYIKRQINYIFNDNKASQNIFGFTSCIADIDGEPYFKRFLDAIMPYITQKFEEKANKLNKYTDKYND